MFFEPTSSVSQIPGPTTYRLHHSNGLVFLDNGTIYYSPNCSRTITIPPYESNLSRRYPFRHWTDTIDTYLRPRWWSISAGYLSFLPLVHVFDNFVFDCLKKVDIVEFRDHNGQQRWKLEVEKCEQWQVLQDRLILVAHLLRRNYDGLPFLLPPPPSMFGFARVFSVKQVAASSIFSARDWFKVWIATLSFLLSQTSDQARDKLFGLLVDEKVEQAWISGLFDFIHGVAGNTEKVGTLLNPFSGDFREPTVLWLCEMGVPVWYRWGPDQENFIQYGHFGHLKYLRPPEELFQPVIAFLVKSPSHREQSENISSRVVPATDPQSARPLHSVELLNQLRDAHIKSKPWERFFAMRRAADQRYYETEMKQKRQTRLNRERIPPRTSADVFLWDWSEVDDVCLIRSRVPKRDRDDILSDNRYVQIYDSIRNQWDVCRYFDFGMPPPEDDDSGDELDKGLEGMVPLGFPIDDEGVEFTAESTELPQPSCEEVEQEVNSYISSRLESYSSSRPTLKSTFEPQDQIVDESHTFDLIHYLSLHFGYTSPLPLPRATQVDNSKWKLLLKNVGLRTDGETNPLPLEYAESILQFLEYLLSPSPVGRAANLWDLHPSNRRAISAIKILDAVPKKGEVFVVNPRYFAAEPGFEWTIAVFEPSDAVKVYRCLQQPGVTPYLLARGLLQDAITFRTLLPRSHPPSSTIISNPSLPMRIRDHQFTVIDYMAYVQQRANILATPRGRAALLHGGIVARLAREHIDNDVGALGPSTAVTTHNVGFVLTTMDNNVYMDDILTKDEINIICGLHRCRTGAYVFFVFVF